MFTDFIAILELAFNVPGILSLMMGAGGGQQKGVSYSILRFGFIA